MRMNLSSFSDLYSSKRFKQKSFTGIFISPSFDNAQLSSQVVLSIQYQKRKTTLICIQCQTILEKVMPADFTGSVFTPADFQKIAEIARFASSFYLM